MNDSLETAVSVVMPAFNAEKTIGQAIQSVLSQSHSNLELIIIEDYSADRTLEIAENYGKNDQRVRVFRNTQNQGVAKSRNIGVEAARFGWVAFLDSDDMWQPDKLEKQIALVREHPQCSVCFTGSAFMDGGAQQYEYNLAVPDRITYRELLKQNLISCSSVLAKREALRRYPMHSDAMIHEDFATWLKILKKEAYAVGLNEPLLIYRIHESSKSGNKLRAAKMQWRTYRHVGLNLFQSVYYFTIYAGRSLGKYTRIHRSKSDF